MSLGAGDQLGDYRIISRLGSGAYGEVFEAEHIITRRRDAVKVLSDSRLRIPEEEERFLREIRVQASLHHPNIAAVYHAFWTPHGLALVMERAPGGPLSALLSRGRIPRAAGMRMMMETLDALAYAHAQGVVHRDIKPENIIVGPDGSVKLTDFGLARSMACPRITQNGAAAGSPCYMSPEQVLGTKAVDARSDTYSAAVVFYEIVTGRLPFTGESAFAVMLAHRDAAPTPPIEFEPAIGPHVNQVILRALEKDPERRFQNAAEFEAALDAKGRPPKSARDSQVVTAAVRSDARRKRLLVAAGVCAFMTLAASYSVFQRALRPAPTPARQPVRAAAPVQRPNPKPAPPRVVAPAPEEPVAEAAPAVTPEDLPRPPATRRMKRAAPPPQKLRFTSTAEVDPPPPANAPVLRAEKAPPVVRPAPLTITSAPTVAPAMPVPEARTAVAEADDDPKNQPAKKRNVMVRAFQRVFGKKPATTPQAGDTPAQPAVPRH